ncbi:MAG TPA: hopanoid biosynthesis-associated protein HpnK [Verrucomicrobiae bacterium]|nr:hopanoid biosynthesis-associated protein HpnK [Verrucomicrobiae bacterium]
MERREARRRLIVNADDFGASGSINEAVERAHQEGILTTASLMVNGEAAGEAVELARQNPRLGVGLHLTLVCGAAALPPADIPNLVDERGRFSNHPVASGFRFFARPGLRSQLECEIGAQFEKFRTTGLKLDHVNGHLHFHLHPAVLAILMRRASEWGVTHLRLTRDFFWLNLRVAPGHLFYRLSHAAVFNLLAARARPALDRLGVKHTFAVFGLLQDSRVDESYVMGLLPRLPLGVSELYSHPSLAESRHEFDALISPKVKALLEQHGIQRIRYQDL